MVKSVLSNKITKVAIIGFFIMLFGSFYSFNRLIEYADSQLASSYSIVEKPIPVVEAAMGIRLDSQMIRIKVLEVLNTHKFENIKDLMIKIDVLNARIDDQVDVLERQYLGSPKDVTKFKETLLEWREKRHSVVEAFMKKEWDKAYQIAQRDGYAVEEFSLMTKDLNQIIDVSKAKVEEYGQIAKKNNEEFRKNCYMFLSSLIIIGTMLTILIIFPIVVQENLLRQEASIDFLTGVPNRRELERQFKIIEMTYPENSHIGVVAIDLDHFKKVNDTYGHAAGDYVLKTFCDIVKPIIRSNDVFARIGGEEFLVVLTNVNKEVVYNVANKIKNATSSYKFTYDNKVIPITISLGLDYSELSKTSLPRKIKNADTALYASKSAGRNCITFGDYIDKEINS